MYTIQNYVLSKEIIINTKISNLPSFSLTSPKSFSQTQKPISNVPQDLIDFFARKSKALRNKLTPDQEELLDKAKEYGISLGFNPDQDITTYDFNALSNDISRWEALLAEARDFGVKWESSNYNPVELDQAIDDHNLKNWKKYKSLSTDNCKW